MQHSRAGRPSFITPPTGQPAAPNPLSTDPLITPSPVSPSEGGPKLNPSTRRPDATRISTYHLDSEQGKFNPPPRSGYIELPPPPGAK